MTIETGSIEYIGDDEAPPVDHRPRITTALAELDTLGIRPVGVAVEHAGRIMVLYPHSRDDSPGWDAVADVDDVLAEEPSGFVVGRGATIAAALDDCDVQADLAEDPTGAGDDMTPDESTEQGEGEGEDRDEIDTSDEGEYGVDDV